LSLVEFKTVEYEGSKQVVESDEIKGKILKAGIRKLERDTSARAAISSPPMSRQTAFAAPKGNRDRP
jgi:hypothetical protein